MLNGLSVIVYVPLPAARAALTRRLHEIGAQACVAVTPKRAMDQAASANRSALIVGTFGTYDIVAFCHEFRRRGTETPILVLAGADSTAYGRELIGRRLRVRVVTISEIERINEILIEVLNGR